MGLRRLQKGLWACHGAMEGDESRSRVADRRERLLRLFGGASRERETLTYSGDTSPPGEIRSTNFLNCPSACHHHLSRPLATHQGRHYPLPPAADDNTQKRRTYPRRSHKEAEKHAHRKSHQRGSKFTPAHVERFFVLQ